MTVVITRVTLDALPKINRAVARLMEEEGRLKIVGEKTGTKYGENS